MQSIPFPPPSGEIEGAGGRKFVLGDIHGELEKLVGVFELSSFDMENDLLIQVGDICDRGKSSYEVVELLMKCKNLILIEGNHDQWLKAYMNSTVRGLDAMWVQQGAKTTLDSYARHHLDPLVHQQFYSRQVPYYVDEANNCFVHGGFNREYKIAEQDMESLAWDRNLVNKMMGCAPGQKLKTADNFNHIYIGHTPTIYWNETKPITRGGVTNIDTGAGKGGMLTMMNVETHEYWQSY
ncbi:MAG: metallophosphoesterase [Ferruginibacter sp.]